MRHLCIILLIVIGYFATSCMSLQGPKKQFALIEPPKNLKVYQDNKPVKIRDVAVFSHTSSSGGNMGTKTSYMGPGVFIRTSKHTEFDLEYDGKRVTIPVKTKPMVGFLIFEGIMTMGIATAVDLLTKSNWYPKQKDFYLIDVPAYLNDEEPRSYKELRKAFYSKF